MTTEYRIGEVAARAEIPASTLRYYERIGLLPRPPRRQGQRVYSRQVFDELEAIKFAQALGFSLQEIGTLFGEFRKEGNPSRGCVALAKEKLREVEQLVETSHRMIKILNHGLTCECSSLNGCYLSGDTF